MAKIPSGSRNNLDNCHNCRALVTHFSGSTVGNSSRMLKSACMYSSFESFAETFEELDRKYESHSKIANHRPDYHFHDTGMKLEAISS